jgi:putative ABC transport system permease protein
LVLIGQGRFGMSASGLFKISGIMQHPLPDMNLQTVYLPMQTAQELLSAEGYITSLLIAPERERQLESVASMLRSEFADDELSVYTWPELIPELLELLEFDLVGAYIISYILYIVIAFGFFGTVLTMTMERIKEFGILISVGMGRMRLAFTLFLEVLAISILGVLAGSVAAFLLIYYFHVNPITLSGDMAEMVIEMGWDPVIPVSFAADQFYTQGFLVFIIAMVISFYPIIKVFNLNVIKASRI